MQKDFLQYLVIFLVMLLFAKEYLGILLKKWLGIEVKNGNTNGDHRIQDLEDHAKIANDEMKEVKDHLVSIEKGQAEMNVKLSIIMSHLKI